ncbi:MAG: class IV adenylate cyclase [archaeon]
MEFEKRAKIQNPEKVIKALQALGATILEEKKQIDTYYGSIELYKKLGHSFVARIRKSGDKYFYAIKTAKPKKDGFWEEYETTITDPKLFESMLIAMGLDKIIQVEKKRVSLKYENITANIDAFKNRGAFIEIELITDKKEDDKLIQIMEKIGISKNNVINIGYISLFLKEEKSKFAKYVKN